MRAARVTPGESLAGHPEAARIYHAVQVILERIGPCPTRVTVSQVAFRRREGFVCLRLPGRWLSGPASEVVLSIALRRHDPSPRFKQVAHPAQRVWMHHLEVPSVEDLDAEVVGWLREVYEAAG
jgi:hypothetical protein